MKKILTIAALLFATPATAGVNVFVDKSEQTMRVVADGEQLYQWPVSTAMPGRVTPTGTFTPYSFQVMHHSRKYHNAPMPYSIFFTGDYAIHGTTAINGLGHPRSHGCVRLAPTNAAILFNLAKNNKTTITITK